MFPKQFPNWQTAYNTPLPTRQTGMLILR